MLTSTVPPIIGDQKSKFITIIVEATSHQWPKNQPISYADVVTLEFPDFAQHPERTYSVTFLRGPMSKPAGILVPGASTKVKDRMEFNVTDTGQS
jgi:Multiubiquitin